MKLYPSILVAALAASLLAPRCAIVAAVPTIANGSFEDPAEPDGTITACGGDGWTTGGGGQYIISGNVQDLFGNYYGTTPFGNQYLGLNANTRGGALPLPSVDSQSATGFLAGTTYAFTFYIANLDGDAHPGVQLTISAGTSGSGDVLFQQTFSPPATEGPYEQGTIDFVPETVLYTPTNDGSATFSLENVSSSGVVGIDNVSLAVAPEPSTWAVLSVGAVGASVVALHHRRVA